MLEKPALMNAEYLRRQLRYEETHPESVYDQDVHDFSWWYFKKHYETFSEVVRNAGRYAEGIVERAIPDDEELMVQYAIFKLCGGK